MAKTKMRKVSDLVRRYRASSEDHGSTRLAYFLNEAALQLPHAYIDRRLCAKIVFMLPRTPGEDSDWVKEKLPRLVGLAKDILKDKFGRGYDLGPEGIRACVDEDDTARSERRRAKRRVAGSVRGYQRVESVVDIKKMKDPELKKEVQNDRRLQKHLEEFMIKATFPPPGKDDDDEDE